MKKQYLFLMLLLIILYSIYLIWSYKYQEYKINSHIDDIRQINQEIEQKIIEWNKIIDYKSSNAFKNKILKEQQWYKNKWELVTYLTSEQVYNTYTSEIKDTITQISMQEDNDDNLEIKNMTIFEKWLNLLFNK